MRLDQSRATCAYRDADRPSTDRYTLLCGRPEAPAEECEEIDVDATSIGHAREIGAAALDRDYVGGLVVRQVVGPRFGMYL